MPTLLYTINTEERREDCFGWQLALFSLMPTLVSRLTIGERREDCVGPQLALFCVDLVHVPCSWRCFSERERGSLVPVLSSRAFLRGSYLFLVVLAS